MISPTCKITQKSDSASSSIYEIHSKNFFRAVKNYTIKIYIFFKYIISRLINFEVSLRNSTLAIFRATYHKYARATDKNRSLKQARSRLAYASTLIGRDQIISHLPQQGYRLIERSIIPGADLPDSDPIKLHYINSNSCTTR